MTALLVLHSDMRACELCSRGARAWFARQGLDYAAFVRGGIDAAILERTGDPFALRVIQYARERAQREAR